MKFKIRPRLLILKSKIKSIFYKNSSDIKIIFTLLTVLFLMMSITHYINNKQEKTVVEEKIIEKIEVKKDNNNHVYMHVTDDGYNVYAPLSVFSGYRYGPSIIYYDDGTADAWFASNADNNEWDWISYKHFDGENWSREKIVLMPTGDSYDHYSVCDPGVIYFNDYYYLAYTSTIVQTSGGINNNLYVARSKNPDGPFEKWNGEGWGGMPKPIIYYDEADNAWGAGEASFVIKDDNIFLYYSWNCPHSCETRVTIGELCDDWPATLKYEKRCYYHGNGQDSADVVYVDEIDKFLAFSTINRFTDQSGICIFESNDGINFKEANIVREGISMYCHNMGVFKRENGHISLNDNLYIGYAYAGSANAWGRWATRFQGIELEVYEGKLEDYEEDALPVLRYGYSDYYDDTYMTGIGVSRRKLETSVNENIYVLPVWYNLYHSKNTITDNVDYEYDDEYIDIKNNLIIPKKAGEIVVNMAYNGFYSSFTVLIHEEGFEYPEGLPDVVKFEPIENVMTIYLDDDHEKQIRAYVEFSDGSWGEGYNDSSAYHPNYRTMVDERYYHIDYLSSNPSVVEVSDNGILTPRKKGDANIFLKINDGLECSVVVKVR